MPGDNVELHRRLAEAFIARDYETLVACFDPSVEFHSALGVGGAVYHGHDGIWKYLGDLKDTWGDDISAAADAYFDLGEQTLLFYSLLGRGRQSGAAVAMTLAQVLRWRDDLCVYVKVYEHREDALKDLGVSEDALESLVP